MSNGLDVWDTPGCHFIVGHWQHVENMVAERRAIWLPLEGVLREGGPGKFDNKTLLGRRTLNRAKYSTIRWPKSSVVSSTILFWGRMVVGLFAGFWFYTSNVKFKYPTLRPPQWCQPTEKLQIQKQLFNDMQFTNAPFRLMMEWHPSPKRSYLLRIFHRWARNLLLCLARQFGRQCHYP